MNQAEHLAYALGCIEKALHPVSDPLAAAWTALKDAEHAADVAQMAAHNAEREYERVRAEMQKRRAGDTTTRSTE